jgi:predicted transcriptional regulator
VLTEEEQVSEQSIGENNAPERQVREKETQILSLSRELDESNVKVEELERTKRQPQAERDELLEKVNNNISKDPLLIDEKRHLEARAAVKLQKHPKLNTRER